MKNLIKILLFAPAVIAAGALSVAFGLPLIAAIVIILIAGLLTPNLPGVFNVVVSNPLIGKSRKSMGNTTFSTWKGINVLKEKAVSVANPNSDGQQQQRSGFRQIIAIYRQIPAAILVGFKKLAVKKSEMNAFISANLNEAFDRSVPAIATLVPLDLVISKGTIQSTNIDVLQADRSLNAITFTWTNGTLQPGQSLSDHASSVVYNSTQNKWAIGANSFLRSDAASQVDMPASWSSGDTVFGYLGFYNTLSGNSSDSIADSTPIIP